MSATNSLLSANLRSHGRRYISTGLAVAISTAFIVITLIVMTAMTSGLTSSVYSQYRGGTIVVSQNDDAPEGAIESAEKTLSATSGVTAIKHMAQWPADAQTDATRAGLYISPMAPKPFADLDLSAGTAPTADDQIAIPEHTALTLSLKVGDTVRVRAGFTEGDYRTLTVVGTTRSNTISMGVPASYVTDGGFSAIFGTTASGKFIVATSGSDEDSNANPPSATQDEWVATANSALSGVSGVTVTSVHKAIQDDLNQARLGASMTMGIMLIFPAIAALVASIVVSSTFRVVLTQRTRELALLRTLGATRRQVRSLVTREALAIGAISSAIGVALGWLVGTFANVSPADSWAIPGAVIISLLGAITIELVRQSGRTSGDTALAMLFYGGIAGGVLLIGLAGGTSAQLNSYLFGSISTVRWSDITLITILGIAIVALGVGLAPALFSVTNDEDFARSTGLPVRTLSLLIAVLSALTVAVAMRVVGSLLVSALMVIPVAIAQLGARSFRSTMGIAMALGVIICTSGLSLTYFVDLSPGATIVVGAIALYAIGFGIRAIVDRVRRVRRIRAARGHNQHPEHEQTAHADA